RDRQKLFEYAKRAFSGNSSVEVVLDRRRAERRTGERASSPDRRRGDRRLMNEIDNHLRALGWAVVRLDVFRTLGLPRRWLIMGAPNWPPYPLRSEAPRRSRGAPRSPVLPSVQSLPECSLPTYHPGCSQAGGLARIPGVDHGAFRSVLEGSACDGRV